MAQGRGNSHRPSRRKHAQGRPRGLLSEPRFRPQPVVRGLPIPGCKKHSRRCARTRIRTPHGVYRSDLLPIFATYRQAEFDKIGEMYWFTPDKGRQVLKPVMAMSVDKKYQPIQTFDFSSAEEVRSWLSDMKKMRPPSAMTATPRLQTQPAQSHSSPALR